MYIINPTQEQLNSWYSCNKKMGEYLIHNLGAALVHKRKNKYYFINSYSFKELLNQVPIYIKIFDRL